MSLSDNDALFLVLQLLPAGYEKWIDTSSTSAAGKALRALAQAVKLYGYDVLDALRDELGGLTMSQRLPDWEAIMGVAGDAIATYGTTATRRARMIARRRESGGTTLPSIRAVVGPLLGYEDPTTLQILECPRGALTALHTYTEFVVTSFTGSLSRTVHCSDDGRISEGGVQLLFSFVDTTASLAGGTITLTGPTGANGQSVSTWDGSALASGVLANADRYLYDPDAAGKSLFGTWTLAVTTPVGVTLGWDWWAVFVEGVGRLTLGEGRGAEIFHWGVYVDPALESVAQPSDRAAALRAVQHRMNPGHARGVLITSSTSYPGSLIPNQFIPRA